MTDKTLHRRILNEFAFDPSFDADRVGVAVENGVVTLSGRMDSSAQRQAVVAAARRVSGVHAIADEMDVRDFYAPKTDDDQLADRALACLKANSALVRLPIDVIVHRGFVTLAGHVGLESEKQLAQESIGKLSGVRGVSNCIEVARDGLGD